METPKTLRRPRDWQDFEDLCHMLWGEVWNCAEIQKNGRPGQEQEGVDIFGIPKGDDGYYGIQCKCKSEYNESTFRFTHKDIQDEIDAAKHFEPPLKKLYIATTAQTDSKIQTYVRTKNLEHRNAGLFEVHIFGWQDIVALIDKNENTLNYYLKSKNYASSKSVKVTFGDDSTELIGAVTFVQQITKYQPNDILVNPSKYLSSGRITVEPSPLFSTRINHSYFPFSIKITNTGKDAIQNLKLLLEFEGDLQDVDVVSKARRFSVDVPFYNIYLEKRVGKFVPTQLMLIGDDSVKSDRIKVKPLHTESSITIRWKLISRDFKDEGQLTIKITPTIKSLYRTVMSTHTTSVRVEEGEIQDFIEVKKTKLMIS